MQLTTITCQNCGNRFQGSYCNICGEQVYHEHEKRFAHFVEEAFHFITHFDTKFFRSFWLIFSKPGVLAQEYAQGRRKKYFSPVSFFMIGVVIYLLFPLMQGMNISFASHLSNNSELHFYALQRWAQPNPTGREGVFESFTPPHYKDLRDAVEALAKRKFGPGGPFHPDTPGPWKDSLTVRKSAQVHDERFKRLVALQAQYMFDTFGKFPATVSSVYILMYLQAQHIDTEYYDKLFKPGAYLPTHPASCVLARRRPSGMTLRAAVSARARGSPNAAPRPRRSRR